MFQVDGRGLYKYLSEGAAIPSSESSVNFNFAAGPGFISSTSKSEYNEDGSYVEAVIATYEGSDYKLCRNCAGQYGVRQFVPIKSRTGQICSYEQIVCGYL